MYVHVLFFVFFSVSLHWNYLHRWWLLQIPYFTTHWRKTASLLQAADNQTDRLVDRKMSNSAELCWRNIEKKKVIFWLNSIGTQDQSPGFIWSGIKYEFWSTFYKSREFTHINPAVIFGEKISKFLNRCWNWSCSGNRKYTWRVLTLIKWNNESC